MFIVVTPADCFPQNILVVKLNDKRIFKCCWPFVFLIIIIIRNDNIIPNDDSPLMVSEVVRHQSQVFLTKQINTPEVADSFLSAAVVLTDKQYSTLNFCKNIKPQCWIWREAEGLKSPETSHHGQRVQSDRLLTRLSPLRSAGSQNHLVKCCVPVRNEPCFGRYTRHNSSGRGRGSWRMEKWQSRFFRE